MSSGKVLFRLSAVLLLLFLLPAAALAKSKKNRLTYTNVIAKYDPGLGNFACATLGNVIVPGTVKKKKFKATGDELPKLSQALTKAERSKKEKKIVTARAKLNALLTKINAQSAICNPITPVVPNPIPAPTPTPAPTASPTPPDDDSLSLAKYDTALTREDARYLLEKAGFGASLVDETLLSLGSTQGVDALVDEFMREKPEPNGLLSRVTARILDSSSSFPSSKRFRQSMMDLWVHTNNPYSEKLALFLLSIWTVSGDITVPGIAHSPFWDYYSRLRSYAQGTTDIPALAVAITRDPLMLRFLDNDENVRGNANENYARELMELFTTGPRDLDSNANYTETQLDGSGDIAAAAKMLTGWRLVVDVSSGILSSRFDQSRHEPGPHTMFSGTSYQFSGEDDQDLVRGIFTHHPNARIYYAQEILKDYLTPNPPRALVEAFGNIIQQYGFQLRPAMAVLFKSKAFYHPSYRDTVPKNSAEFIVEAVRSLEMRDVLDVTRLEDYLVSAAMPVNDAPSVFWFPVSGWTGPSVLLEKINLAALASGASSLSPNTWSASVVLPQGQIPLEEVIQSVATRLGTPLTLDIAASLQQFGNSTLLPNGSLVTSFYDNQDPLSQRVKGLGLYYVLMGTPAFQLK